MDMAMLFPAGAALLPMLIILGLIGAVRHGEGLRRSHSPFNRDFLRPAGFSRQRRLEELGESAAGLGETHLDLAHDVAPIAPDRNAPGYFVG